MRPPQNAGEDDATRGTALAAQTRASMRPPQNAGEDGGWLYYAPLDAALLQ